MANHGVLLGVLLVVDQAFGHLGYHGLRGRSDHADGPCRFPAHVRVLIVVLVELRGQRLGHLGDLGAFLGVHQDESQRLRRGGAVAFELGALEQHHQLG